MTAALDFLNQTVQSLGTPSILDLPLDSVHPDPDQPRQNASENRESLEELAESFKTTNGPVQPILVEPHPHMEGQWQIVAGERRYLAAALAGFQSIRAITLPRLDDEQRLTIQLVENDQREELDLLSRAHSYERLLRISQKKPAAVARSLGISHSKFTNTLRVLRASELAREGILEKLLIHAEAVRLFEKLPEGRKRKILDAARKTGNSISRTLLEQAVQDEQKAAEPEPGTPSENASPQSPPPSPLPREDDLPEVHLDDEDFEAQPLSLPPLAARYLRRLFDLLGLAFPADAREAPARLIEFLTGDAS